MAVISKVLDNNGKATGKWRVRINMKGQRPTGTFKTQAEATTWARDEEKRIEDGARGVVPQESFGWLLQQALAESAHPHAALLKKHIFSHSDAVSLEAMLKGTTHWKSNKIIAVPLRSLTDDHVKAWIEARLFEVSLGTVQRNFNTLQGICTRAIKSKILRSNPFTIAGGPGEGKARTRRASQEELDLLLANAPPKLARAILLAEQTGMRQAEICAINPATDVVGSVCRVGMSEEEGAFRTKTAKKDEAAGRAKGREVPLTPTALAILADGPIGLQRDTVSRQFHDLTRTLGIENLRFHDLRANFCTWASGVMDILDLAKAVGHADTKMLMKTYYRPDVQVTAARFAHLPVRRIGAPALRLVA